MSQTSVVSVFTGPVSRTWRIGPRRVPVTLSHNTLTGSRTLYVDSGEVLGTSGSTSIFSATTLLPFEVDGWVGRVILDRVGAEMKYTCVCKPPSGEGEVYVAEDNSDGSSSETASPKLRVSVCTPEDGVTETGELVVYYVVTCTRETDGRGTRVHRRFRDFFSLHEAVRSAYKGSQLLGSIPEPPPRGLKFFENHQDPAFIERRRWMLADFLYKLESVPRMRSNADFLAFCGLVGNVRETSCFFPKDSPLGLSLASVDGGRFTEVTALKPLPDGRKSPAMISDLISPGDKVSKATSIFYQPLKMQWRGTFTIHLFCALVAMFRYPLT